MRFNMKSIALEEKLNQVWNALSTFWKKLIVISVFLLGVLLFVGAEYGLANMIIANQYSLAIVLLAGIVVLLVTIGYPFWGYVIWFVMSCDLRLFNNVLPRKFNFDLLMLGLIVLVLVFRALAQKRRINRPSIEEVFLILAFVYEYLIRHQFNMSDMVVEIRYLLLSPCALYFIVKSVITQKKHIYWLMIVMVITGFSWALLGIYEQYAGKMWLAAIIGADANLYAGIRSVGPAGFYYLYGNMLILTVLFCLHILGWMQKLYLKLAVLIICLTSSIGLYYGYSRAPYIAFALSLLIMLFLAKRTRWIYAVCITMLFIATTLIVPVIKSSNVLTARFSSSVSGRMHDNKTSMNMFKANYLFGVGPGRYREFVPEYVSKGHGVAINPVTGLRNDYTTSHSEYFRTLCELGVVGFFLYFGMYALFIRRILKIRTKLPKDSIIGYDFAGIAFAIAMVLHFTMFTDQFEQFPFMYAIIFAVYAMLGKAEAFLTTKAVVN